MKKFTAKRKRKKRLTFFLLISLVIISFSFFLSYFSSLFSKKEFLDFLINSNLTNKKTYKQETNIFDFLLDYTIGRQEIEDVYVGSDSPNEYIPDPDPLENKEKPVIYLYNTHQGEEYNGGSLSIHDITPTVMLGAYRLREELNNLGFNTIVETNQISEVLRINNWNYASSYKASKILMTDALEQNPTLKYFFDLHRDSIAYENSIVNYQNKSYAKVLFVIGTDHSNFNSNLALAQKISTRLNELVPNLSRGIMKKGGKGVNGIYNQDFSPNTLLFELGGQYNSIEEVTNTISVLVKSLQETIVI